MKYVFTVLALLFTLDASARYLECFEELKEGDPKALKISLGFATGLNRLILFQRSSDEPVEPLGVGHSFERNLKQSYLSLSSFPLGTYFAETKRYTGKTDLKVSAVLILDQAGNWGSPPNTYQYMGTYIETSAGVPSIYIGVSCRLL